MGHFKGTWLALRLLLLSVLGTGCGTAKVMDVHSARAARTYSRIAVVVHGHENDTLRIRGEGTDDMLSSTLVKALVQELESRHVETRAWLVSPLELNPEGVDAEVEAFRPDAVLLSRPSGAVMENWKIAELYHAVVLVDAATGQVLWKGTAEKDFNASLYEMAALIGDSLAQYGIVMVKRQSK